MFHGVWFECAPGSSIINGELVQAQPPAASDIELWLDRLTNSEMIRNDVVHRYILTKRGCKNFANWAKRQFFFRNATAEQIQRCGVLVGLTS